MDERSTERDIVFENEELELKILKSSWKKTVWGKL